jgi:sporulation protein YlmC with PRC-barrel domain
MRQRRMLSPVLLSVSLLLAPAVGAQQEVIDPQAEPGTESQPASPAAPTPSTVPPPAQQSLPLATSKPTQQDTLVPGSTMVGTTVKDRQGGEVGKIQELMIEPQSGRIRRVVISFGGTLGINEKRVEIPWEALTIGLGTKELVVEVDKEQLGQSASGEKVKSPPVGR